MPDNFPFIAGLLASMLHVITGSDHLAAVMPFAVESKRSAWKIGFFWGFGHLAGMLSIGILFMVFEEFIPIEAISNQSEKLVGFVLLFIGFWSFYKIFKKSDSHKHVHIHANESKAIHSHDHLHASNASHEHHHPKPVKQSFGLSFSVGFLHGLAGVAHFILFLPMLGFANPFDGVFYMIGFALGVILAMSGFTFVVGRIAVFSKSEHNEVFFNGIRLTAGLFAIVVGVYWLFLY
jgi:ABC-type nickel/cobalt efflux system permease component RcnA